MTSEERRERIEELERSLYAFYSGTISNSPRKEWIEIIQLLESENAKLRAEVEWLRGGECMDCEYIREKNFDYRETRDYDK